MKNKKWKRKAKRIVGECLQERNKMMFCESCENMHCISYDIFNIRSVEQRVKEDNTPKTEKKYYLGIDWARGYK